MIGQTISHYRVLEQLGAGGMGVVYLAEDVRLNRKVALKFLAPGVARDTTAEARLLREAQSASALDHPHIATVYEIGDYQGQLFIAMAYYAGETLRHRIDRGPIAIGDVAAIAGQIADGLATAHAAGIIHRDLKPANVIITPTGQAKILDFGLAKVLSSADQDTALSVTGAGTTVGTVAYMAPEQARGEHVDQRADVWAFGAVLYEMLTGRTPFGGQNLTAMLLAVVSEQPPPVRNLRPDAPAELERIVTNALQKDVAARTLTAAAAAAEIERYRARTSAATTVVAGPPRAAIARRRAILLALVAVLAIAAAGWWTVTVRRRAATETALAEIARLVEAQEFVNAYALAARTRQTIGNEPRLVALWGNIVRTFTVQSSPPAAEVSIAEYGREKPVWHSFGTTPIKNTEIPRGLVRWRVRKAGHAPIEDVTGGFAGVANFVLPPTATAPRDMVWAGAPRRPMQFYVNGGELRPVTLGDFWIDRHEVTNRQFKAFVEASGYQKREYWKHRFVKNGRTLSWDEAMAALRDATGRPGPAAWELGTYPAGQDDVPVTGVSWYEAAAYAEFAGRKLPTFYHWNLVAGHGALSLAVVPMANYASRGPVRIGSTKALHRFGAYDLAGNVKEWCENDDGKGRRYVLGGGWDEPAYMYVDSDARSPFERARNVGFRCIKYTDEHPPDDTLSAAIAPPSRDYAREKPASDEVLKAYKRLYSYDRTPIAATVTSTDTSSVDWSRETVTFAAPYGNERITVHVFLPKRGEPPFHTIAFFPGANAWDVRTSESMLRAPLFDFLMKSGRAVVLPVFKGAYERGDHGFRSDYPKNTSLWRDHVIAWYKDLARTLDYVETRRELAVDKIGYVGFSRGGAIAPVLLAQEPRIKTAVFWVPGFYMEQPPPEVDAINFAPRMTIPTLVLNGRYDYTFPEDASQVPFFHALGTPPDRKRRVVYDAGHNLPQNQMIKETLDWFDRHLGAVR